MNRGAERQAKVAMVMSVWISTKKPKLATGPTPMSHMVACRVVEMTQSDEPTLTSGVFHVTASSTSWVVRPESIVAMLEPERYKDELHHCRVELSAETMKYLKDMECPGIISSFFAREIQGVKILVNFIKVGRGVVLL